MSPPWWGQSSERAREVPDRFVFHAHTKRHSGHIICPVNGTAGSLPAASFGEGCAAGIRLVYQIINHRGERAAVGQVLVQEPRRHWSKHLDFIFHVIRQALTPTLTFSMRDPLFPCPAPTTSVREQHTTKVSSKSWQVVSSLDMNVNAFQVGKLVVSGASNQLFETRMPVFSFPKCSKMETETHSSSSNYSQTANAYALATLQI